jgi:hypothetical protein
VNPAEIDQDQDILELTELAKRDFSIGQMAAILLRAYEIIVYQNEDLAQLQGLEKPLPRMTDAQYRYVKQGLKSTSSRSPWLGDPPPVSNRQPLPARGRRIELRSRSARDRQREEAETQLQEDHNPSIPLSMTDLQGLPY